MTKSKNPNYAEDFFGVKPMFEVLKKHRANVAKAIRYELRYDLEIDAQGHEEDIGDHKAASKHERKAEQYWDKLCDVRELLPAYLLREIEKHLKQARGY